MVTLARVRRALQTRKQDRQFRRMIEHGLITIETVPSPVIYWPEFRLNYDGPFWPSAN